MFLESSEQLVNSSAESSQNGEEQKSSVLVVDDDFKSPEGEMEKPSDIINPSKKGKSLEALLENRGMSINDPEILEILKKNWLSDTLEYTISNVLGTDKFEDKMNKVVSGYLELFLTLLEKYFPKSIRDSESFNWEMILGPEAYMWTELHDNMSEEEWDNIWNEPETIKYLSQLATAVGDQRGRVTPRDEEYNKWVARDKLSFQVDNQEDITMANELCDSLKTSGLEKVMIPMVESIKFGNTASYSAFWNGEIGQIKLGPEVFQIGRKYQLLPTLIHETGHALNTRLLRHDYGITFLYRYAALLALEDPKYSVYSKSWKLKDSKEGGDYFNYTEESFAEDFRLYWLKPEALMLAKKALFDKCGSLFYKDVNTEEVREKTSKVLGNYYGISVQSYLDAPCRYNEIDMCQMAANREREWSKDEQSEKW